MTERYELVLTPPAVRAVQFRLSEAVAAAVIEFVTSALLEPGRVGAPLHGDLACIHAARRGTYRVLYRINDDRHEVVVLRIDHRGEVYRPQ